MPSFTYTGPGERVYPETRDANGAHLGTVTPGDIRMFDEPPADGYWTPEVPPREDGGGDQGAGGDEADAGEPHDEAPPGPQPAPPAVIPGA